MTLREMKDMLAKVPEAQLDDELKVWLPGSTISLVARQHLIYRNEGWCVEGNIDEGSALLHG